MPEDTQMLTMDALVLVADRFKVLSEPLRLMILQVLQDGELSVTEVTKAIGTSQPNASKHLKVLQDAGMIGRRQQGNTVYYRIVDDTIFALCDLVCSSLRDQLHLQATWLSAPRQR
jgi:ArsR family transcriptional regulator